MRPVFWKHKSDHVTVLLKTLLWLLLSSRVPALSVGLLGPTGAYASGLCASPLLSPLGVPCASALLCTPGLDHEATWAQAEGWVFTQKLFSEERLLAYI